MLNYTLPSFGLSNTTTNDSSSLVWGYKSLTAYICPSESPPRYCTSDFYFGPPAHTPAEKARKYWGVLMCLLFYSHYLQYIFPRLVGNAYLRLIEIPPRHLHRLPPLLQSYLTSSPFTLTLNAVFDSIHLGLFYKSEIPWSSRFKAIHIFNSRDEDAAARTAMKRNFFSLVWTITLFFYATSFSEKGKCYMIAWTFFSFAALLTPFLALWFSNGEELSALELAVKAQEMGDEKGQKGEILGNLVNVPAEWRKKFKDLEVGWACWMHGILFTYILAAQYTAPSKTPNTGATGTVTNQDPNWTHWLSNVEIVPPIFAYGLALALFCMWVAPRNRAKDMGIRGFSAFWGSFYFARALKDAGVSCTWGLWLGCDGLLWGVDEWLNRMQTKRLRLEFEELVREGLEERTGKQRDMYKEVVIPGP